MCSVAYGVGFLHSVCDPVMGDNGHLYVKPDLVPVYREKVCGTGQICWII